MIKKLNIFILVFTAAIFVATFSVFYFFSRQRIEYNARIESENRLQIINLQIEKVLRRIEAVPDNFNRIIARGVFPPDSMYSITRNIVRNNPDIYGSAIAFEPFYFKEKGYYFSPYSFRDGDTICSVQLGNDGYDYFNSEWYSKPKELGKHCWSEPYYEEGGGPMVTCTYSAPIYAPNGELIGIFTSDISLEWLNDLIESMKRSDQSYTFMLGMDGTYIAHYKRERILNQTIFDVSQEMANPDVKKLGEDMITGKEGMQVLNIIGVKSFVFYAPVPDTQWSVGIVLPIDEIFGDLQRINRMMIIVVVMGLIVLFMISSRIIKMQQKLSNYMKIENELQIARNIQMSMIPKKFPPFPSRSEIDLFAVLNPAKEVGGDLYDFFIEGDKLYFAIGDVSGKGIPASLLMAVTLSQFRSVAVQTESPGEAMNSLNKSISENNNSNMFITLMIGMLNLKNGELKYCNAGHNPPILVASDKTCHWMKVIPNLPVGVVEGFSYIEQSLTLKGMSTLVLYTDGIVEAVNARYEQFGTNRLLDIIHNSERNSARETVEMVLSDINQHVKDYESLDDITMLVIDFNSTLEISNEIEDITKVSQFIKNIGKQLDLPSSFVMNLNLATEEALSNIIKYAYINNPEHAQIKISVFYKCDKITIVIIDNGTEFDPTRCKDPDITLPANKRPVGGLGIFIIRQTMSEIDYKRINGKNILTMTKIIDK